ncbi:respiratory nitrate reductase subunit gamma [Salinispora arenicola]|uniref:respiratory nitrate reductase subunit gamma n=1 Tax=Salinispora arenicola TaxID=168697 RepID=UPI00142FA80C|nr:respiratory nitrate reductase subunit gamma [Salinispora arenicola]NIL40951.1 respiratory nitrate reductase subunit gamma [Salinispora arenicola]
MNTVDVLLWVVYPYLTTTILIGGLIWRYRYDKFGWTTRSSQLYETTLLRWGSPLFHFGVLMVLIGHVVGLLIPTSWTEAVGISQHNYHFMAVFIGTIAGFCTLAGMIILIVRRRLTGPVFAATTRNDKAMYVFLAAVIMLGLWNTVRGNITEGGYDYRADVSPWFRSLFYLSPDPELMAGVPIGFQLHVVAAFALFAFWPFTRLVHAFSAPIGYVTRPYVVYRSHGTRPRRPRPGWEGPPQLPTRSSSRGRRT